MSGRIVGVIGWLILLLICVVQITLHASGYYGASERDGAGAYMFMAVGAVVFGCLCFASD